MSEANQTAHTPMMQRWLSEGSQALDLETYAETYALLSALRIPAEMLPSPRACAAAMLGGSR